MKLHLARPEHEVAYQDICALASKHAAKLSSAELLAIAANMVGKMIALQDQRAMTPAEAMEIVANNIEYGNQTVVRNLAEGKAGSA